MKGRDRYGVEAVHFREGGVMLRKEYDIISAVSRFRLRSQAYGVFFFSFPSFFCCCYRHDTPASASALVL